MIRLFPVSLVATFSLICCVASVNAADEFPKTLLGFVKPGMYAVIRPEENSDAIQIGLCSEEAFLIVKAIMDSAKSVPDQTKAADRPETAVIYVDPTVSLCKILHVGDDYILVLMASGEHEKQRQVVPSRFISKIQLPDERDVSPSPPDAPNDGN